MGKNKPELNREFFEKCGAKGGKIGGKRASESMTAEQKTARALKAVAARKWHRLLTPEEEAQRAAERAANRKPRGRPRIEKPIKPKRPVGRPRKPVIVEF